MLIQVTTTHGKPFWCADIQFRPRPTRLWCGDAKSPDANMQTITAAQLVHMEQFTGEHGPLYIEKEPTFSRQASELFAEYSAACDELARVERRATDLAAENEQLRGRLGELEAQVAAQGDGNERLRGQVAGLEAHVAELKASAAVAEKRAIEAESRADKLAATQKSKGKKGKASG